MCICSLVHIMGSQVLELNYCQSILTDLHNTFLTVSEMYHTVHGRTMWYISDTVRYNMYYI